MDDPPSWHPRGNPGPEGLPRRPRPGHRKSPAPGASEGSNRPRNGPGTLSGCRMVTGHGRLAAHACGASDPTANATVRPASHRAPSGGATPDRQTGSPPESTMGRAGLTKRRERTKGRSAAAGLGLHRPRRRSAGVCRTDLRQTHLPQWFVIEKSLGDRQRSSPARTRCCRGFGRGSAVGGRRPAGSFVPHPGWRDPRHRRRAWMDPRAALRLTSRRKRRP
jgi:hypothetical protein